MKIVWKPVCAWLFQLVFRMDNTISWIGVLLTPLATPHFQAPKNCPFPIFQNSANTGWRAELWKRTWQNLIQSGTLKLVSCHSLIEYGQSSNLTNERIFFAVRDKCYAKWKENWIAKKNGKNLNSAKKWIGIDISDKS